MRILPFIKPIIYKSLNLFNNKKKLELIKNRYFGQRCFIIGNGPSIIDQDLTHLKNEITFVSNRFILHTDFDLIQPNYYCISDNHFINDKGEGQKVLFKIVDKVDQNNIDVFFPLQWKYKSWLRKIKLPKNLCYLLFKPWEKIWETKSYSYKLEKGTSWGHTVIIDFCLPLAMYMGFKDIYLLGCDMNYGKNVNKTHFYKNDRKSSLRAGNDSRDFWNRVVKDSYQIIYDHAINNNITIHNATNGGYLEIFPRVDYDNLFT